MMKNEDIQANAKHIADIILRGEGQDSPAESIQALLSYSADNKTQHPFAVALVEAALDFIFEAATPEQVIL